MDNYSNELNKDCFDLTEIYRTSLVRIDKFIGENNVYNNNTNTINEPYNIKYPIPILDVKNSPLITPIKHIDIFILNAFSITLLLDGNTR